MICPPNRKFFLIILILATLVCLTGWDDNESDENPTTLVFPPYLHSYGIRKATKFHLFLFMQNRVKFRNPQDLAVVRLDVWDDSTTEEDDDEVTVYGVNSGQNNIIYNVSMSALGVYGLKEHKERRLNKPMGIAANERGDVFICDSGNNRVVRLFNDGKKLDYVSSIGRPGYGRGEFRQPYGVALDSQDNLYVTDRGNHRIQVFYENDSFKNNFGVSGESDGRLHLPEAIAVNDRHREWTFYRDNFIVVIDLNHSRLQKFDLSGKYLKAIHAGDFGYPNARMGYLALDYYSNIYVTDQANHCVHKFDRNLNYLTSFGSKGSGDREFIEPRGITIHRRFGQVFIAEKKGAQYYWIGTDYLEFSVKRHPTREDMFFFEYFLTEPSFITADIFDTNDKFVTRIWYRQFKTSGAQKDLWSCFTSSWHDSILAKDNLEVADEYENLNTVPTGTYFVRYRFEPTYSSLNYFSKKAVKKIVIE
ncbi:hypothetical protein GF337_12955 [candidate division KSB1 bacterium]|nr:hypothetical protein [candidate division KSB1 bacterium]